MKKQIILICTAFTLVASNCFAFGLGVGGFVGGGGAARSSMATQPASWDLLDNDCSSLTGWTPESAGSGANISVSPEGQWRFYTGESDGTNALLLSRDIGSIPDTFTIEVQILNDVLGTRGANDFARILICQSDEVVGLHFASDGFFLRTGGPTFNEVGTDLVKFGASSEWQTWRILVTLTGTAGAGTCDVYLNDSSHVWSKVGTGLSCSWSGEATNGLTTIYGYGYTTSGITFHINYIKIASGLTPP